MRRTWNLKENVSETKDPLDAGGHKKRSCELCVWGGRGKRRKEKKNLRKEKNSRVEVGDYGEMNVPDSPSDAKLWSGLCGV